MRLLVPALLALCCLQMNAQATIVFPAAPVPRKQPAAIDFESKFGVRLPDLGREAVRKELRLSNAQTKTLMDLIEKHQKAESQLVSPGARRVQDNFAEIVEDLDRFMQACEQEAIRVLTPDQARRLREIGWQQLDKRTATFLASELIEKLEISRQQVRKFEELERHCRESLPTDASKRPAFLEACQRKKLSILTAEQQKKWQEMLGKPFKGALE